MRTKVKKNSHRSRDRRNKIKARVRNLRARRSWDAFPRIQRRTDRAELTPEQRSKNIDSYVSFMAHVGEEHCGLPSDMVKKYMVLNRFDAMFNTDFTIDTLNVDFPTEENEKK